MKISINKQRSSARQELFEFLVEEAIQLSTYGMFCKCKPLFTYEELSYLLNKEQTKEGLTQILNIALYHLMQYSKSELHRLLRSIAQETNS